MSITPATSEALTPMNKSGPQARKPGTGTGQPGGNDFAQLLRLQAQADEPAPPDAAPAKAQSPKADEEGSAKDESEEGKDGDATDKSKLPKKLQLGAEDLGPELRPAAAATGAPTQLLAERGRDAAARLGSQGRAQRAGAAELGLRLEANQEELKADSALRFGDAFGATLAPDVATPWRAADGPERPLAPALLTEALTMVAPQPEATASVGANPLPSEISAPPPLPTQATLEQTPGTQAFTAALGAQLSVWVSEGVEMAQLELNPRDLGPIEVRIAMRDGQARIELGADVSSTRDALAQALPALSEALGDVGVQLAGSGLSDHSNAQRQAQQEAGRQPSAALAALAKAFGRADGAAARADGLEHAQGPLRPRSLVDLVA